MRPGVLGLCGSCVLWGCGSVSGNKIDPVDAGGDASRLQHLVTTPSMVMVPEGASKTLDVLLGIEPSAPVVVHIASSNPSALAVSPESITFTGGTGGNWSTPVQVEVHAPVDKNNVSETATLTVSGDGAGDPVAVPATVQDATVVKQYGWPPPEFTDGIGVTANVLVAYQITIDADTNLDAFGVFSRLEVRDSLYRMALYRDASGRPGAIVAQMAAPAVLGVGAATFDLQPDVAIDTLGTGAGQRFWLAFESSMGANLRTSATVTTSRCTMSVANVTDPWPVAFDPAGCSTGAAAINVWIDTYRQ